MSKKPKNDSPTLLLPLTQETVEMIAKKRAPLKDLSGVERRAVRATLKNFSVRSGLIPVSTSERTILVLFLGKKEGLSEKKALKLGKKALQQAKALDQESVHLIPGDLSAELTALMYEGLLLESYAYKAYKGENRLRETPEPVIYVQEVTVKSGSIPEEQMALIQARKMGVDLTRDLINQTPGDLNPQTLEEACQAVAKDYRSLSIKVLREKQLMKMGMGGILGVGQGSHHESRLILLEYKNTRKKQGPLAMVGKGVTYDTGGLSMKPPAFMKGMKMDLGGAATVLGTLKALCELKVEDHIIVAIPAVENAVSSEAYHPDDILKMYNGMTVEVTNTDAEGRLILADALTYVAEEYQPRKMIDVATLTGAVIVALGHQITGFMSQDAELTEELKRASGAVHENFWELPLHQDYLASMKSELADICNAAAGRSAGTIEGGIFLQHFVPEDLPWAHLDIAGTAKEAKNDLATGDVVRSLVEWGRG